jgi:hypothetical protein
MESRFIYRLFDSERPEITRYVGCTANPEFRLYQHGKPVSSSALVRPWSAWLRDLDRSPSMEVLSELRLSDPVELGREARIAEQKTILSYARGNQWLLNAAEWKRDKIAHGIDRHVVAAYLTLVTTGQFERNFCTRYPDAFAASQLEKAFPRLCIFHCRYVLLDSSDIDSPARCRPTTTAAASTAGLSKQAS